MLKLFGLEGVEAGKVITLATRHKSTETGMLKVAESRTLGSTQGQQARGSYCATLGAVFSILVRCMVRGASGSYTIQTLDFM